MKGVSTMALNLFLAPAAAFKQEGLDLDKRASTTPGILVTLQFYRSCAKLTLHAGTQGLA